jgi:catechol 2,3-dioxygenase-like lactoylglutathione lyase family enzyme
MKIEGIDRLVFAVKDMNKAVKFLSNLLGMEFKEITGPMMEAGNIRLSVGSLPQKGNLSFEILQVIDPLKDVNPPGTKAIAKSVEEVDGSLFGIAFRVKDAAETAADLERKGVRISHKMELEQTPFGVTNLKELITEEKDTLGIKIAFVEYQEPTKDTKG